MIYLLILLSTLLVEKNEVMGLSEEEKEVENLYKIIQKFSELKSEDKLPLIRSNDTGGKLEGYKLNKNTHPWVNEAMLKDIKACNDLYVIDVEFKEKRIKYFFCIKNSVIKLISIYRLFDNKWVKSEN